MLWLKLADRLGMSLQQVKATTTSSEFVLWKVYLDDEPNHFHRSDYYLAQIAQEVQRVLSKTPEKVLLENFLLSFSDGEHPTKTESSPETKLASSKAFWLSLTKAEK